MRWDWRDNWRKVTLARHRSELRALRLARRLGFLAIFPIALTVFFWWFALGIPLLVVFLPIMWLVDSSTGAMRVLGMLLMTPLSIAIFALLFGIFPWFFRWYAISVALMFGRKSMADRAEAELIAAIAAGDGAKTDAKD